MTETVNTMRIAENAMRLIELTGWRYKRTEKNCNCLTDYYELDGAVANLDVLKKEFSELGMLMKLVQQINRNCGKTKMFIALEMLWASLNYAPSHKKYTMSKHFLYDSYGDEDLTINVIIAYQETIKSYYQELKNETLNV